MGLLGKRPRTPDAPEAAAAVPTDEIDIAFDLLASLTDAVLVIDGAGRVQASNAAAIRLFGDLPDEFPLDALLPTDGTARSLDGSVFAADARESTWTTHDGRTLRIIIAREVTPSAGDIERDQLTGLPTRNHLLDVLRADAAVRTDVLSVLVFDIDQFSVISQTVGYQGSDELLRHIASNVERIAPPQSQLARLGDDTFCLAFRSDETSDADRVAAEIRDATRQPVNVQGRTVRVTASVGSSLGFKGTAIEQTVHEAELAKQEAGRRGGNRCVTYTASLRESQEGMMRLWNALRSAIQFRQMEVWFQPIVSLATGRPIAAEALCRWHHPNFGDVAPGEFIPIAERNSEILNIGGFVQERAAEIMNMLRSSRSHRVGDFQITINASANELAWPRFAEQFLARLKAVEAQPGWFVVETTERALLQRDDAVAHNIAVLRQAGVDVSLDDYGADYASIERLRSLPVDRVKIDRRFIAELLTNERVDQTVAAAVNLANELGLKCIAEGVETDEQAARLRAMGCAAAQGFLFAPAVPDTELLDVLRDLAASGQQRRH
jgi:diguanylate cyclase (GGDEF)-like protein